MRAIPRTPWRCDGPRGSLSMRPFWLAGQRALQARLARLSLVSLSHRSSSDRRTTGVSPHHTMTCTDVEGRVTDGAVSSVAVKCSDRAKTVTRQPLSGWCGCVYKPGWLWPLRMAKRASQRATRGGERQRARRHGVIAFAHRTRNGPCDQCGQGGLVFLALAGPAVLRFGDSAPRWPAGSLAQWWQRPRMWICVGPRDPAIKPSRGWLWVMVRKPGRFWSR